MKNKLRKKIPFFHITLRRPFTRWWFVDIFTYFLPFRFRYSFTTTGGGRHTLCVEYPGFCKDIYNVWHRARYGYAPRDTWNLDSYLNGVLAGSLEYLALTKRGSPAGYPNVNPADSLECEDGGTNHEEWTADLNRWAHAFSEDPNDVSIYDRHDGYEKQRAEEDRRRNNIHKALKEIEPWWEALWD